MKQRLRKDPGHGDTAFTIGRAAFAKISAVEGIHLTTEMQQDFRDFERARLSPEKRRRAITRKYGRAR